MGSIVKGLFGGGGGKALSGFKPSGFTAPGLSGSFAKNQFNVSRTAAGESAVSGVQQSFLRRAEEIGKLRPSVAPGFGALTTARVDAVRTARGRTVGNLREELGKRRVLGSRFAQDETAREEARFGQLEADVRAQSFLEELSLTRDLINDESLAAIGAATAVLGQLNFESEIAAKLSESSTRATQANALAQAELQASQSGGAFQLLGTIAGFALGGPAGAQIGSAIGCGLGELGFADELIFSDR